MATALALAPLVIYGNRPGQEIEYPMAIVILGGLAPRPSSWTVPPSGSASTPLTATDQCWDSGGR
jgi:hypothetical protein